MLRFILLVSRAFIRASAEDLLKEVLMRNLLKSIAVFAVLSVALSGFTSCTSTTSSSKDTTENAANTNSAGTKGSEYPPAPSGIMQAEIKDIDGNAFKLEDKKGKVVLVNLWATWCGPCRAEMPELVAMQDKYKDKGFEIIGLDTDEETPEEIKTFAQTMKLNYQLGFADPKLMSDFLKVSKFQGIPQSFLIDREGKLRNVFVGGGGKIVNQMKEAVEKTVGE